MKRMVMVSAVVVVVLIGIGMLAKNVIAKLAVTSGVKAITGLELRIRRMDVGLFSSRLGIEGLQVFNPTGFHEPVMVDMPEIFVRYDLGALVKGHIHLPEVRLNLRELTVVKNERGEVNLNALQAIKAGKAQEAKPQPAAKPPQIQLDVLELHIGKVFYKDYSTFGGPQVREFNVNVHEQFHNVTNPYALAGLIVTRALGKTTLANIIHLDLGALESDVKSLIRGSLDFAVGGVGEVGRGALDTAQGAVKGTTDTLKKILGQ
ncbi:MAG: hypothetical protein HYZ89_08050 [Candidatus Omnitrophica bacterium]|nr:hypothetical protein [Candidatus Omnitrophota bacterium]